MSVRTCVRQSEGTYVHPSSRTLRAVGGLAIPHSGALRSHPSKTTVQCVEASWCVQLLQGDRCRLVEGKPAASRCSDARGVVQRTREGQV